MREVYIGLNCIIALLNLKLLMLMLLLLLQSFGLLVVVRRVVIEWRKMGCRVFFVNLWI